MHQHRIFNSCRHTTCCLDVGQHSSTAAQSGRLAYRLQLACMTVFCAQLRHARCLCSGCGSAQHLCRFVVPKETQTLFVKSWRQREQDMQQHNGFVDFQLEQDGDNFVVSQRYVRSGWCCITPLQSCSQHSNKRTWAIPAPPSACSGLCHVLPAVCALSTVLSAVVVASSFLACPLSCSDVVHLCLVLQLGQHP